MSSILQTVALVSALDKLQKLSPIAEGDIQGSKSITELHERLLL